MEARVPNVCLIIVTAFPRLVCVWLLDLPNDTDYPHTQAISLLVNYQQVSTRYINKH
jgi:hypothetical protein